MTARVRCNREIRIDGRSRRACPPAVRELCALHRDRPGIAQLGRLIDAFHHIGPDCSPPPRSGMPVLRPSPPCPSARHDGRSVAAAPYLGVFLQGFFRRLVGKFVFCLTGPYLTGRATIGRLELPSGEGRFVDPQGSDCECDHFPRFETIGLLVRLDTAPDRGLRSVSASGGAATQQIARRRAPRPAAGPPTRAIAGARAQSPWPPCGHRNTTTP